MVVQDSAIVSGYSIIRGNAIIKSNAFVKDTVVDGRTVLGKNAYIIDRDCYLTIENIGSRHDATTFYLDEDSNIWVNTGCFNDTLEAFEKVVIETHGENRFARQYIAAINLAKTML